MTKNIGVFAATALAILVFALAPTTVMAQSYSGNYQITWDVTYPSFAVGVHTFCLTLTDDGSIGFPHSGEAILNGDGDNDQGVFQVINNELVATFLIGTANGELDTLIFAATASKGTIGKGFGDGSFDTITGALTFGKKGSCGKSE